MKRNLSILVSCLILAPFARGQSPAATPERPMRNWTINGQSNNTVQFQGRYLGYENQLVRIERADGHVRDYIAAQLVNNDLYYVQSQLTRFPEGIRQPPDALENALLLHLSAADLTPGPLTAWPNRGTLGGTFHAMRSPLNVVERDEGRAVRFYYGPWVVNMDFQTMVADTYAPPSLDDGSPYSMAVWIYGASPIGIDIERRTFLSWRPRGGDGGRGTEFGHGINGRYPVERRGAGAFAGPGGSFGFPDAVFPSFNRWQHIVYVYSGGDTPTLTVYLNGEEAFTERMTAPGAGRGTEDNLLFLGCHWNGSRPQRFFAGDLADLKLFTRALTAEEIAREHDRAPVTVTPLPDYPRQPPVNAHNFMDPAPDQPAYFTPEFDGLVSEPFPADIRHNGDYGKIMEGWGHPVIGRDNCPDEAMILCAYTMARMLHKRPDLVAVMQAIGCAARLDHGGPPWLGWSEFVTACYGQSRTFFADPGFYWGINIMVHEMGHQFHMWGGEHGVPEFRRDLFNVFWENKKEGKWAGDYGGLNMWEFIASAANHVTSDGSVEEAISRREKFRLNDPRKFYFLEDYWPGERLVDLTVRGGLRAGATGRVLEWENSGGLEYWGKFGLTKHPWTTGTFTPVGSPQTATVQGVPAVVFDGESALAWNRSTRECLIRDYAWSVELWAHRDAAPRGEEVLLSWGPQETGVRVLWGNGTTAASFGDHGTSSWNEPPAVGEWQHIVYNFEGGGLHGGPGRFSVYVNGRLDHRGTFDLEIPAGHPVTVGGVALGDGVAHGFTGALAHVRVHDYALSEMQLLGHFEDEKGYYQREDLPGGTILVDLDARHLSVPTEMMFRPLYPATLDKPWLRAWSNRGLLAGKVSNDIAGSAQSRPMVATIDGITAVRFTGSDRMISSFAPSAALLAGPMTVECWVRRDGSDDTGSGILLQWGALSLPARLLSPDTWHLVTAVISDSGSAIYIDGDLRVEAGASPRPGTDDRLHLGMHWDGTAWQRPFRGAIAQLRIRHGALSAEEIRRMHRDSDLQRPDHPVPAPGTLVVADRTDPFTWNPGLAGDQAFDLYLGTDRDLVERAGRDSAPYLGQTRPGAQRPRLMPAARYYWRVDAVDADGDVIARGPVWAFRTHEGRVIDLDAATVAAGAVEVWANRGAAGGQFTRGDFGDITTPEVSVWDDRKGVDFTGGKRLDASFELPARLLEGDFTLSFWSYNSVLSQRETMISMGAGADAWTFNHGWDAHAFQAGQAEPIRFGGASIQVERRETTAPIVTYWNHLAYVFGNGRLRIYVNGVLNQDQPFEGKAPANARLVLGAAYDAGGQAVNRYIGRLADVSLYGYVLSPEEIDHLAQETGSDNAPDTRGRTVHLPVADLEEGPLAVWENRGGAGGALRPARLTSDAPVAGEVAGRPAVTFDGARAFMQSDIPTPACVTGMAPVTLEMWVHTPRVSGNETVFSLAPRQAFSRVYFEGETQRALEFRYATGNEHQPGAIFTGANIRAMGWNNGRPPEAGQWQHLAFVYDGHPDGQAQLYVNGQLHAQRGFYTLYTQAGLPMFLGTAWNTDHGTRDLFSGSLNRLRVYDYARTGEEIASAAREGSTR